MNKYLTSAFAACCIAGTASAMEWDFNGFVSAGGGLVLEDGESYYGFDDSLAFEEDSKIGLQIDVGMTDKLSATVQGVVRGRDDWDAEVEWAYLSYELNNNWKIRLGRLRGPFYMISDYIEVGYAYPWLRPPEEVYDRLPVSWVEGVDIIYTTTVGGWDLQAQTYYAEMDKKFEFYEEPADLDLEDIFGLAVTTNNDWLTLRASYHQATSFIVVDSLEQLFAGLQQAGAGLVQTGTQLNIPPLVDAGNGVLGIPGEMNMIDKTGRFLQAGFIVDPGESWFVRGEWTGLRYDRHVIPESSSYYTTAGWRDRDFTYFLTFAHDRTNPRTGFEEPLTVASALVAPLDPVTAATLDFLASAVDSASNRPEHLETWTLGLRWDFRDSMAFKAEYAHSDTGFSDFGAFSFGVDMVF